MQTGFKKCTTMRRAQLLAKRVCRARREAKNSVNKLKRGEELESKEFGERINSFALARETLHRLAFSFSGTFKCAVWMIYVECSKWLFLNSAALPFSVLAQLL